ncbi:replication-relaxation family protein [Saccharopolyspora spinosa]|uniref:replication-relaxation family protein n=1 Tax=Saccharopolyspora spinosa TaxID=60894 RepID=UPI001ED91062|nr:replication-relaxation family protein [Saccharopolyspora spinosa]
MCCSVFASPNATAAPVRRRSRLVTLAHVPLPHSAPGNHRRDPRISGGRNSGAPEFFWNSTVKLHPDGYGCWAEHGRWVRFVLEYDTGTEALSKVTHKIADYSAFPTDSFGILLFSVHSAKRERALRQALRRAVGTTRPPLVIATTHATRRTPTGRPGRCGRCGDQVPMTQRRGASLNRPPPRNVLGQLGTSLHCLARD